jgi:hypothetical protein
MIVQGNPDLLQIVAALHPPGSFAGGLYRRQQERHEHPDNGDDDKKLDERKTAPASLPNPRIHHDTSPTTPTKR